MSPKPKKEENTKEKSVRPEKVKKERVKKDKEKKIKEKKVKKTRPKKKNKTKRRVRGEIWAIIVTLLLIVGSLALAIPPQERIHQGLDIQGGLSVVLSAETDSGTPITAEDLEKSKAIIESRVNALGASEATVTTQGTDQILVQIPGMSNSQEALDAIGQTGVLEFASLDSITDSTKVTQIKNGAADVELEEGTYEPVITGENIQQVTVGMASEASTDYAVNLRLDGEGARDFGALTTELYPSHGQIAIILDGVVQSAPSVQSAITNGEVSITGNYTIDEAKALQTVLESGSLPVTFVYEQSQTVGPTLGQGELAAGVVAALTGLLVVMIYLLFFYKGLGLLEAANICVFAVFYLGVLAVLSFANLFALSLAGIAGIILTIGMAADSSILIVERFKEELSLGHTAKAASTTGVRHAIITSIDANVVTVISAICLFTIATSSVKGFGLTLALGIIINIFVMLIFTSPLIRLLANKTILKHPGFWGVAKSLAYAEETANKTYTYLDDAEPKKKKTDKSNKDDKKAIESETENVQATADTGKDVSETVSNSKEQVGKKTEKKGVSKQYKRKRHADGSLARMPKQYKDRNKRPYDKTKKKPKKFVPQEKPDYIPAVILTGGGAAAKAAAKTAEKTTEHVDGEINDKVNEKVTDKVIENVSEHVKGNDVLEQPTVDATAEKTNDTETTQDERIEENTEKTTEENKELTEETTKDAEEETKSVEDNNAETDSAEEKTEESEDMPKSTNKEELVVEPVSENFDLDQTQDIIEEIEEAKIVAESLDADKEGTTSD